MLTVRRDMALHDLGRGVNDDKSRRYRDSDTFTLMGRAGEEVKTEEKAKEYCKLWPFDIPRLEKKRVEAKNNGKTIEYLSDSTEMMNVQWTWLKTRNFPVEMLVDHLEYHQKVDGILKEYTGSTDGATIKAIADLESSTEPHRKELLMTSNAAMETLIGNPIAKLRAQPKALDPSQDNHLQALLQGFIFLATKEVPVCTSFTLKHKAPAALQECGGTITILSTFANAYSDGWANAISRRRLENFRIELHKLQEALTPLKRKLGSSTEGAEGSRKRRVSVTVPTGSEDKDGK
ncbi:hypothetical protein H0H93_013350 [Arthromyces matolae]|nr:hypothetical protein H0H93_013350 [Arthromyces matolae]